MKASIWFSNTTSACSTVLYQSTICLNLLVRRTACANLAGTIFFDVLLPALPLMMRLLKTWGLSCDHRSMLATRQSLEPVILVGIGWVPAVGRPRLRGQYRQSTFTM